jgi:hypothetical protein
MNGILKNNQEKVFGKGRLQMKKDLQKMCICPMCPTFVQCGEALAYCLPENASSKCITTESGCLCPGCPVQEMQGYTEDYYCIPGKKK